MLTGGGRLIERSVQRTTTPASMHVVGPVMFLISMALANLETPTEALAVVMYYVRTPPGARMMQTGPFQPFCAASVKRLTRVLVVYTLSNR